MIAGAQAIVGSTRSGVAVLNIVAGVAQPFELKPVSGRFSDGYRRASRASWLATVTVLPPA